VCRGHRPLQTGRDSNVDMACRTPEGGWLRSAVPRLVGWTLLALVTLSLLLLLRSFSPAGMMQRMAASVSLRDLLTLFAPVPHRRDKFKSVITAARNCNCRETDVPPLLSSARV